MPSLITKESSIYVKEFEKLLKSSFCLLIHPNNYEWSFFLSHLPRKYFFYTSLISKRQINMKVGGNIKYIQNKIYVPQNI